MPSEINIEKMITDAMKRGEFDNLKGKGKPLDLDDYFATPEDLRMGHSILKANDFVPEEVELLNETATLTASLNDPSLPEAERVSIRRRLTEKRLALDLLLERSKRRRRS
jgi:hypothetical protein